jgi:nucleotide-binding universal stress UspA family protein
MYDEILVPTDGSDAASRALDHALNLANQYDARVHALYVIDANAYATLEAGTDVVISALEDEGQAAVDTVVDRAEQHGVEAVTEVVTGTVHKAIIEYADEHDVDLIVMGTHGRRGLDRYLLGSVTEKVVRTSAVPVLTIQGSENGE